MRVDYCPVEAPVQNSMSVHGGVIWHWLRSETTKEVRSRGFLLILLFASHMDTPHEESHFSVGNIVTMKNGTEPYQEWILEGTTHVPDPL